MADENTKIDDDAVQHTREHDFRGGILKNGTDIQDGSSTYTDEDAQDAVGTILSSEFVYDDSTPEITLSNSSLAFSDSGDDNADGGDMYELPSAEDGVDLQDGLLKFSDNLNLAEIVDIDVTSTVQNGDSVGYAFNIDGSEYLRVHDTANGSGGTGNGAHVAVKDRLRPTAGNGELSIESTSSNPTQFPDGVNSGSPIEVGGNTIATGVVATGSVTLSSGSATVDTGVATSETATFQVALGPATDDADVAAEVRSDSGSANYEVDIVETQDTFVGNPTVEYDVIRVR